MLSVCKKIHQGFTKIIQFLLKLLEFDTPMGTVLESRTILLEGIFRPASLVPAISQNSQVFSISFFSLSISRFKFRRATTQLSRLSQVRRNPMPTPTCFVFRPSATIDWLRKTDLS